MPQIIMLYYAFQCVYKITFQVSETFIYATAISNVTQPFRENDYTELCSQKQFNKID